MIFQFSVIVFAITLLAGLSHAQNYSCSAAQISNINALKAKVTTTSGPGCACELLNNIYSTKVLTPGNQAYEAQATNYWDIRSDLTPSCIFMPVNPNDVAVSVVIFDVCQSEFAVRGGGHMPVVGAANTNGGVLVALSAFTNITVGTNTVSGGPALNWYEMQVALQPYQRIVIGGRMKSIGIAGLTLGGGISWLSSKYGFVMDNVLAFEVVLGNGEVVNATATTNSDLFWALKGGGNNYGIVTKFTYNTYSAPAISTAIQIFAQAEIPEFIGAIASLGLYQDNQGDTAAGGIFTISYDLASNTYNGRFLGVEVSAVAKPAVFNNFTTIPSEIAVYNVTTLVDWAATLDTPFQQNRIMFGMHVALITNTTMQAMYSSFAAAIPKMAAVSGFGATLVFQPLPSSATAFALNNGIGNTWGLDARPYVFWQIETQWVNESDDGTVQTWAKATIEAIHTMNIKAGVGLPFIYYNDGADYQDAFATFPSTNLAKMKTVRSVYDPSLIFTNLCTGGYKLEHGPIA